MATIGRVNGASFNNTPRLSYIATGTFNSYFYSYSTSLTAALETVGTLGPVTGATAGNCPAGRVLRENGRKLYPSANPGITTYMVGVYDNQTMLSGFIDPNAGPFQIYNTDKPTYLQDGVEPTLGTTDRGPSIFTRGNVLGGGDLDISGNAVIGGDIQIDGDVTASADIQSTSGQIFASTLTTLTPVTATASRTISPAVQSCIAVNLQFTAGGQTLTIDSDGSNVQTGMILTLRIFVNASHTTAGTVTFGTLIVANNITLGTTASRHYTITFMANGNTLYEIGRASDMA